MQVSTVVHYPHEGSFVLSLAVNFIHAGNCWNFLFHLNEIKIVGGFCLIPCMGFNSS